MEITLPVSHIEMTDLRGAKRLSRTGCPVFVGASAREDSLTMVHTLQPFFLLVLTLAATRNFVGH